uniref:Uncharacterized protein n=2 Tax=Oryza sativa subsp. japonica TaxID=39947 RepID=Q2R6I8_ORYSJ|nr:hypothetical protein LOC_Os11g19900 [Oryza sativa Japonica Group]ABA93002.1 hypothetical protein LOC_Os11g19900 [Oryza sativa Japonica Group]
MAAQDAARHLVRCGVTEVGGAAAQMRWREGGGAAAQRQHGGVVRGEEEGMEWGEGRMVGFYRGERG